MAGHPGGHEEEEGCEGQAEEGSGQSAVRPV